MSKLMRGLMRSQLLFIFHCDDRSGRDPVVINGDMIDGRLALLSFANQTNSWRIMDDAKQFFGRR